MFCPQARCRTIAPDSFKVLLSQRRRWINSTIHNLMELVRVQNLCGTFCFSMQFVVFMELIGTVVLPVAICLTYTLIINYAFNPPTSFSDAIPLLLLGGVLGLPAILILLTTGKIIYLFWMLVYLLALPVWNFILPVYAFWHFDDFSWGETRKVEGEGKDLGHVTDGGKTIEVNAVPLRRWDAWEKSRLRKARRDEKRRQDFQRAFGSAAFHNESDGLRPNIPQSDDGRLSTGRFDSETASLMSREDDRWGFQIGQYSVDDSPNTNPPPVGLYVVDDAASSYTGHTLAHDQMAAMLDEGWDDDEELGMPPSFDGRSNVDSVIQYDQARYPTEASYTPGFQGHSNHSNSSSVASDRRPIATAVETWQGHAHRRSGGQTDDFMDPTKQYYRPR